MVTDELRIIRVADLATSKELTIDERISVVARAMEWLAVAQALVMIHGKNHAAVKLDEMGCPIRFDADGEPVMVIR